jgi:hypothetical protein
MILLYDNPFYIKYFYDNSSLFLTSLDHNPFPYIHNLSCDYLAGLFDGDGHIKYNPITNTFVFKLTQHYSNIPMLWSFCKSFNCGSIYHKHKLSPILD